MCLSVIICFTPNFFLCAPCSILYNKHMRRLIAMIKGIWPRPYGGVFGPFRCIKVQPQKSRYLLGGLLISRGNDFIGWPFCLSPQMYYYRRDFRYYLGTIKKCPSVRLYPQMYYYRPPGGKGTLHTNIALKSAISFHFSTFYKIKNLKRRSFFSQDFPCEKSSQHVDLESRKKREKLLGVFTKKTRWPLYAMLC